VKTVEEDVDELEELYASLLAKKRRTEPGE
jgi:hypothetical protein